MAFDQKDGYVVLFGGQVKTPSGTFVGNNATWTYRGGTWTQLHPAKHPAPRDSPAMAYDAGAGDVLLFGGSGCGSGVGLSCNDTWSFHAGNWTRLHPTTSPPATFWVSMTYDAALGHVLLFDGQTTWDWLGTTWHQLSPSSNPKTSAFGDFQLVYDPVAKAAVLASAFNLTCAGATGDCLHTWEFASGNWTELGNTSALGVTRFSMTWDPAAGKIILFGGNTCCANTNGTWGFHGTTWTQLGVAASPSAREFAAMGYDGSDKYVVLFGGLTMAPSTLNDTWKLG